MEMATGDLPPHFDAWYPGKPGNNPAYVSLLRNALHSASGIAVNAALWAANGATLKNAMLASLFAYGLELLALAHDGPGMDKAVHPS